jgi:hypothetical protein
MKERKYVHKKRNNNDFIEGNIRHAISRKYSNGKIYAIIHIKTNSIA